jgi:hypothetical protein
MQGHKRWWNVQILLVACLLHAWMNFSFTCCKIMITFIRSIVSCMNPVSRSKVKVTQDVSPEQNFFIHKKSKIIVVWPVFWTLVTPGKLFVLLYYVYFPAYDFLPFIYIYTEINHCVDIFQRWLKFFPQSNRIFL